MLRILLIILISFTLGGCITSRPEKSAEFGNIAKLKQLEGFYKNDGEVAEGKNRVKLSSLIGLNGEGVNVYSAEKIEIRITSDTTLVVKAYSKEGVLLHEQLFTQGKDFEITGGTIRLSSKTSFSSGVGGDGGNLFIGPYYEGAEIGIDQQGHGKYRSKSAFGGLVVMLFPLVIGFNEDVRFEKIGQ